MLWRGEQVPASPGGDGHRAEQPGRGSAARTSMGHWGRWALWGQRQPE